MLVTDTPRILIIGVGSIGERHLRCFQKTGRCNVALCEPNADLRQRIAAQYSVDEAFDSIENTPLDRFDAAVVCTPAQTHIPIAAQLVQANLHVLVEKPLSIGLDGIDQLKRAAEERQRVVGVAYVHRANPLLGAMKAALDEGRFGEPRQIVAVAGQHFPTMRPAYRDIYYAKHETGGGAIQDAITHVLKAGEWLVGPLDRLAADAAHQLLEGVDVEDTVHIMTRQGGVLGSYNLNQFQSPNEMFIQVNATKGSCRYEPTNQRWRWMTEASGQWHDETDTTIERDTTFIVQANAMLDCITGKRDKPFCALEEGEQTLRVNLAALRSAADGSQFISV